MISPLVSGDGGRLEEGLGVLIGGLTILTDELERLEEYGRGGFRCADWSTNN